MGYKTNKLYFKDVKKVIISFFISLLVVIALTPAALAGTTDQVTITFDPAGFISIDVSPNALDFGTIIIGGSKTHASALTVYNNGTSNMNTYVTSSNATDMVCDNDGSPAANYFSVRAVNGSCDLCDGYITFGGVQLDSSIANSGGSEDLYVEIILGAGTSDHGAQTMYLNFSGSPT